MSSSAPALETPRPPRRFPRRWRVVLGLALLVGVVLLVRFVAQVRAFESRHATGPAWAFPSRVWSTDIPLVKGALAPVGWLRAELALRGYRERYSVHGPGEWAPTLEGAEIWLRAFDAVPGRERASERVRLRISGGRITEVRRFAGAGRKPPARTSRPAAVEPMLVATIADSNGVAREYVPLARIPLVLRQAAIAAEDRRFRSHWGLDLKGNARALLANLRAGQVRQGASTITQQLVRGLFLGPERSFARKLSEMPLAILLERVLPKDRILEMYLNCAYFGRDEYGGIAGVAEASRRFFGEPVESLTTARAAMLVGVIPAPNLYSPVRRPDHALRRRWAVLRDMVEAGVLDSASAIAAGREPLGVRASPPVQQRFPSFVSYVRQHLGRALPAGAIEGWGLDVMTTLDPVWQHEAEAGLASSVDAQEGWRGRGEGPLQGAFVLLDNTSGEVRALVGGRDPGRGDFNRATQALRQPGSAIKPVVYAAALDPRRGGVRFTPGSTVPDLRREFATPEGPWKPRNDEGEYHESVTLAKALAKSLNVATANLVEKIGAGTVSRYADRFGLGRPAAVASIGLGTHEVTPLALVSAYTVFPNGGWRHEPVPVRVVLDAKGHALYASHPKRVDVLPAQAASLARGMLENVVTFGISNPLREVYGFTRPCGGKTGTTNDYHDAWFVGFTPEVTAGVWIGYDQPRSLARPAARVALPAWAGVMSRVLAYFPPTPFPVHDDESLEWIDPWTGLLARADCPSPLRVPFARGTAPRAPCTRDHTADWAAIFLKSQADSVAKAAADSAAIADSIAAAKAQESDR
jgi:penicillin-binding protein 1B